MRFLLDTNILIPAEPTSPDDVEATTSAIVDLLNALSQGAHRPIVHPASLGELSGDQEPDRARTRSLLVGKYALLEHPPALSSRLIAVLGAPRESSNTHIDTLLLSAVEANAVDYFVTEDHGIHRRARRVGLSERVLTVADAILTVRALFPTVPQTPPLVTSLLAHQLNDADPIFTSFREDYPEFDTWLTKCKREHRRAWVVTSGQEYAAICIVNNETPNEYGFRGKVLKICSFKIAERFRGYRYGELILKTIFSYLVTNGHHAVFVEAFAKHQELFSLLNDFGFEDVRESSKGERVLLKTIQPDAHDTQRTNPLEFNIKYGPYALKLINANAFLVPIRPKFHDLLFPELRTQMAIATESHPFGNSIRKAYLCHSKIRRIEPGDLIAFYRSERDQALTAFGVAETTLVSSDATEVARFVGRRTVYSYAQIEEMAAKPILAVLFRLARPLETAWSVDLLMRAGIIKRAPQSFMQLKKEAVDWIATRLDVPH